jgi:hypothetical protein
MPLNKTLGNMKYAWLLFCTLLISVTASAQSDSTGLRRLPFVSFNNPNVPKRIKEGRTLTIHLYTDSAGNHTYNGPIFVGDPNSLLMVGGTEQYQGYSDGGFTYEERITSYTSDEITVIPHKEIEYISLQPRLRPVFSTLVIASLAVVCIGTPIAITGYSNLAGESVEIAAGTLVVNAVLYKVFHTRKFRIKGNSISKLYSNQ